ncbi:hypothetical protein ASG80_13550 [Agromyces sp. Soil535]|nr:hypothetical protein ASG80_13550 [Agromyces sp. Soil535]
MHHLRYHDLAKLANAADGGVAGNAWATCLSGPMSKPDQIRPATGADAEPNHEYLRHPESERMELSVRNVAAVAGFHLEVAPSSAIDAFTARTRTWPERELLPSRPSPNGERR